jgi:predicted metal-dependent HD superfamily phosphohydrolase
MLILCEVKKERIQAKMLKEIFSNLFLQYSSSSKQCDAYWSEIESYYTAGKRYYHNLHHLQNLYTALDECRSFIEDWNTILFSLFYHDIIYKATRKDNEERSALLAVTRLKALQYPSAKSALCSQHILATKKHMPSKSKDTNLFTDADLSILGADNETYVLYIKQIRKEYAVYPDFMYNPGRKKVLQHFLQMERIYKTDHFFNRYEQQARENMAAELQAL